MVSTQGRSNKNTGSRNLASIAVRCICVNRTEGNPDMHTRRIHEQTGCGIGVGALPPVERDTCPAPQPWRCPAHAPPPCAQQGLRPAPRRGRRGARHPPLSHPRPVQNLDWSDDAEIRGCSQNLGGWVDGWVGGAVTHARCDGHLQSPQNLNAEYSVVLPGYERVCPESSRSAHLSHARNGRGSPGIHQRGGGKRFLPAGLSETMGGSPNIHAPCP